MTPTELWQMFEGLLWRLDQQRRIAAVAANLIAGSWVQAPGIDVIEEAMGKHSGP